MIYVEATEKYRRLQDRAEAGVNEYFDQLLAAQLTDGERKTVAEGLQLLDKALTAGEEEAAGKKSKK